LYATGAGDLYNLTSFAMCAHNGTHVDAPFHFVHNGKTVDQMDLTHFVGDCFVARHEGDVTAADAEDILKKAGGAERILIAGNATVTAEAAAVFAAGGIKLLGNEGQTVGPEDAPMQVHLILLHLHGRIFGTNGLTLVGASDPAAPGNCPSGGHRSAGSSGGTVFS